ncbi:MAG: succinylglutamate desuccinylase/aspartoacylase family protein, partial [Synergistaceae bacterium]|nr:succinylglutamate desuccinylase/aspartoacylase family protein [Synergistaceae bacterium]
MKGNKLTACLLLALAVGVCFLAGREFAASLAADLVVPAEGFEQKMLSDYFDGLRGSPMDTPVFVQNGPEPGGSVLILGGTHPNEPSGYMSAVIFLENARVERGRLFVIPFGNMSGFSNTLAQEASPNRIHFTLPGGSVRSFRYGSRDTSPLDMWPTPDIYIHKASGQELAGNESKNLNRAYPGDPDGTPVERLAYGIMELLRKEKITLAFDLHEASPEYPVVEAIVAHERSMELAATAAMELIAQGIEMRLEPSPKNLRGLSHREWGDATETMPILMESANPSQGRLRGRTDEALVLAGVDKAYLKAAG